MSLKQNIIYLYFKGKHLITSKSQYQYNHGQYLYFADLNLPQAFEVHFSNKERGESKTQIGSNKLVEIPDEYFWNGALQIYAWVYLHDGTDDGETIYEVRIPLIKRAKPTDEEPLPVQQSAIDKAIAELNNAVDITNENADKTSADKTQVATIKEEVVVLKEEIDSTASAVSQDAQSARESAERSEQSAQNSAESERKALDYSDEAKGYAQSALESKNIANQKAQIATDASAEAKDYRDEALTAKNDIVDYRDETKGYRDETLIVKNNVQTIKEQIDETANDVNEDAQNASQSAAQARADAELISTYRYLDISADVLSLNINGDKTITEETEFPDVWFKAYKGKERLHIDNVTGYPVLKFEMNGKEITVPVSGSFDSVYGQQSILYMTLPVGAKVTTDTTTSDITFTASDSEGNTYTFTKTFTLLIVKDGEKGDDGESGVYIGTDEPEDRNINVWVDTDGNMDTLIEKIKVFYIEFYYDEQGVMRRRILDNNHELSYCVRHGIPTILCFVGDGNESEYYFYTGSYFSQVYHHVWASAPMRASNYTNFSKLEIKFLTSYDFKNVSQNIVNIDASIVQ